MQYLIFVLGNIVFAALDMPLSKSQCKFFDSIIILLLHVLAFFFLIFQIIFYMFLAFYFLILQRSSVKTNKFFTISSCKKYLITKFRGNKK